MGSPGTFPRAAPGSPVAPAHAGTGPLATQNPPVRKHRRDDLQDVFLRASRIGGERGGCRRSGFGRFTPVMEGKDRGRKAQSPASDRPARDGVAFALDTSGARS
jgi:hypothetical protein